MKIYIILLATLTFILSSCHQRKDDSIEKYFQYLKNKNKFNGNALIIHKDSMIYDESFGYARGNKKDTLNNEYYFEIGSIYKEFPAVAIMKLKESGKISLEDKLSKFNLNLPEWANKIEVKNLLQYSSGLPVVDWEQKFQSSRQVNLDNVLSNLQSINQLEFEPGHDYIYSNYNPFLLINIVESVTNSSFNEYLNNNILKPYKLEGIILNSSYPYSIETTQKYSFAFPFNKDFEEDDMEYQLPTICATMNGLFRWFKMLDEFKIISRESLQFLSQKVISGNNIQSPIGRGDWIDDELQLHLHHGSTGNYECLVRNYKEEEIMIILLTNQKKRNLHDIADDVVDIIENMNNVDDNMQ